MSLSEEQSRAVGNETCRPSLEDIEHAVMQISWLGQRHFMHLLEAEPFRLTLPQFYTLLHLNQASGQCKMSDLAEATHQSAASLTGIVDRLIEKQLVVRTRHERDRRQVMVVATARGSDLITEIQAVRRKQTEVALAHLRPQEIDTLLNLLDRVIDGMSRMLHQDDRLPSD